MSFYVGLDLGQMADYTALSVLHYKQPTRLKWGHHGPPVPDGPSRYECPHLERFPLGTDYPAIVQRVKELMTSGRLPGARLVVDATGVGRPVVDLLRKDGLQPIAVTIHGGDAVIQEGDEYRVPKRELVGVMQVLLQTKRLQFARSLPLVPVLIQEMQHFKVKINAATAHDSYGAWRDGQHDDLILSVSLAAWWGEYMGSGPQRRTRSAY